LVNADEDFRAFENRGLLLGYYLLDDQYSYELALRMADRITLQAGVDFRDLRTVSAGIMSLLTAYQASGRPRYLASASQLVELVLDWQRQQGGGLPTDFIYKAGLVMDSLVAYYQITKDQQVLDGIRRAVDHALYHFWDRETSFIQNRGGVLFTSGLDLLYRETGEEKYYLYNKDQVNAWVNQEAVQQAKDVALHYRTVFTFFNSTRAR
jgi:rhamnogalacturonyl hydrolase YesR